MEDFLFCNILSSYNMFCEIFFFFKEYIILYVLLLVNIVFVIFFVKCYYLFLKIFLF